MSQWIAYEAEGDDYVPMERWGEDHWSTLGYLEARVVDHKGVIENAHMRCHARLHREFLYDGGFGVNDGSTYPTRLKDGELQQHDDWSCVEDMVAAGLVTAETRVRYSARIIGNSVARVRLTESGLAMSAKLRAHKANGGSFGDFSP